MQASPLFGKQMSPPRASPRGSENDEKADKSLTSMSTMGSGLFGDVEAMKKMATVGTTIFGDVESMKRKLRDSMSKPHYDVTDFYVNTGIFQFIARHKRFEAATLSVIALNALWISIDTDHNSAEMLLSAQPIFQIAEHFFCTYFSFEWFCRYKAFKRKRDGLRDGWFVFDSIMVFMMVFETWLMTIILLASGASSGGGGMGNASILRLARLMRLSRMMRMARLLRAMPELLILIKGMVAAMRSVFFTLALLAIFVYVFGIMFTQLTVSAESHIHESYFKTVPLSMHTLILDGTLLDNVGQVVKDLGDESIVYAALFYLFVLLAALTMMNMLIGVLCEVVSSVATTEREELTVNYVNEKLRQVMAHSGLDADGDGQISREEFAKIIDIPEAANTLTEVGIDVVGLVDLSDFIFAGAEDEDEDKVLSFGDFLEVILQLRGSNTATVKDIVDLRKFVRTSNKVLEDRLEAFMMGHGRRRRSIGSMVNGQAPPEVDRVDGRRRSRSIGNTRASTSMAGCRGVDHEVSPRSPTCFSGQSRDESEQKGFHLNGGCYRSVKDMHESEEKLWVRLKKLEEHLLVVQQELANVTEVMTVISGLRGRTLLRWQSSGNLSDESTKTPLTPGTPLPFQNWEINCQTPFLETSEPHVCLPGVPDTVLPPLSPLSNSFGGDQLEELQKEIGSLEQCLLASMGRLHAVRSRLDGFSRNAAANGVANGMTFTSEGSKATCW